MKKDKKILCPVCLKNSELVIVKSQKVCANCSTDLHSFLKIENIKNPGSVQLIEKSVITITAIIFSYFFVTGFMYFGIMSIISQQVWGSWIFVFGPIIGPISLYALSKSVSLGAELLRRQYGHHTWFFVFFIFIGIVLAISFNQASVGKKEILSELALLLIPVTIIAIKHFVLLLYFLLKE